jgi:hypothetical protein
MVTTAQAATGLTTGQMGMLYALICHDSSAVQQTGYATWSISGSNFTLTLPTFTNPVYPIVLSPAGDTFGYTTAGSSSFYSNSNGTEEYGGRPFPSTANGGTATSIQYSGWLSGSGSGNAQMGIYTDGATGTLVGYTGNVAVNSQTQQWWSANISAGGTIVANTNYVLAVEGAALSMKNFYMAFTSGATGYTIVKKTGISFPTWGTPGTTTITWTNYPFSSNEELSIYVTYTTGGGATISNSPSSVSFGTVMPGTTYYAYNQSSSGSYPNPVTSSQCYFTITNGGSGSVNLAMSCSNATGSGNTWTLVSSSPSGDQFEVIAVYNGENPSSGLVLTNSNQSFYSSLGASGTLLWDFKELLGGTGSGKSGTFSDNDTKTYSITITGS